MAPRVVVLGSLHYDITVQTSNWPRQGETAVGSAWAPKLGGKGRNQAVAAAKAGASVEMIGAVGDDEFGRELLADLSLRTVGRTHIRIAPRGSGMSVALFEPSGDYRAVIVSGANLELGAADVPSPAFWSGVRVLVLQNEVPDAANALAAAAAKAASAMVILNAAPARPLGPALAAAIDLLVVNAVEAAMLTETLEPRSLGEAEAAAKRLARDFPQVVVTAGGAGLAFASGKRSFTVAAEPVKVVSTHGAGDTFVGALAAALAGGETIEAALAAANHAAALLVSGR